MDPDVIDDDLPRSDEDPTASKRLALDSSAISRPPTCATDEASDDGSIFEDLSDQDRGHKSQLCVHCQFICDN